MAVTVPRSRQVAGHHSTALGQNWWRRDTVAGAGNERRARYRWRQKARDEPYNTYIVCRQSILRFNSYGRRHWGVDVNGWDDRVRWMMTNGFQYEVSDLISDMKLDGRYPTFIELERIAGEFPTAGIDRTAARNASRSGQQRLSRNGPTPRPPGRYASVSAE
jgi:hypothetical protein